MLSAAVLGRFGIRPGLLSGVAFGLGCGARFVSRHPGRVRRRTGFLGCRLGLALLRQIRQRRIEFGLQFVVNRLGNGGLATATTAAATAAREKQGGDAAGPRVL